MGDLKLARDGRGCVMCHETNVERSEGPWETREHLAHRDAGAVGAWKEHDEAVSQKNQNGVP